MLRPSANEIRWLAASGGGPMPVHTIFFGGGTLRCSKPSHIGAIWRPAGEFSAYDPVELSMEANPGTVSLASLRALHALGVNR
jgi:oxygen-independent coproporphyrinogen-3 oxidase